jgi:hypothetical protein
VLLAAGPAVDGALNRHDLGAGINRIALDSIGGGRFAFATAFDLGPTCQTSAWQRGSCLPKLGKLIEVSRKLGVDPVALLRGTATVAPGIVDRARARIARSKYGLQVPMPVNLTYAREKLEQILAAPETPLSIREIADGLGCRDHHLYSHFQELCFRIVDRRKAACGCGDSTVRGGGGRRSRNSIPEDYLLGLLSEEPPPSLKMIASRVAGSTRGLYASHNALARELSARYCSHIRSRRSAIVLAFLEFARSESPAPRMSDVGRRIAESLGIRESSTAYGLFPELCREITTRHREESQARVREQLMALEDQVRRVVERLQQDGGFPSVSQVISKLRSPASKHKVRRILLQLR